MATTGQNPLRQQMINMMYLVLLALMALNVSAEILKAFQIVGKSIEESIVSIEAKNNSTMKQFEAQLKNDRKRTEPYYNKALEANKESNELYKYIEDIKQQMIQEADGIDKETGEIAQAKDTDIPTRMMIENGKGAELQNKINQTREDLIAILRKANLSSQTLKTIQKDMVLKAEDPVDDRENRDWATYRFQSVPVAAAVTLLTKVQNDVKNTQADIIDRLLKAIAQEDIALDVLTPVVKMTKSSFAEGEKVEAQILLAAYSSTQNPTITLEGQQLDVANGSATWTTTASSVGEKILNGKIIVKNPTTGEQKDYPYKVNYDVFKAPAIISADAMRVLYRGLDNPISVSVPGYKPEDVFASISGGSLTKKSGGNYIAKVSSGRKAKISVSVKTKDGNTKAVGSEEFKIKPVPKPTAYFGSKASGEITPGEIGIVHNVSARMGDFVFEGVKYTVSRFQFIYQPKRGPAAFLQANSSALTGSMEQLLRNPQKGDLIIITNIDVKGPDGTKRLENGITLTVK